MFSIGTNISIAVASSATGRAQRSGYSEDDKILIFFTLIFSGYWFIDGSKDMKTAEDSTEDGWRTFR
jgi:hypothetical protein